MKKRDEYLHILRSVKEEYAAKYGIELIGLFGSVARNEHTEDSDIDVFVSIKSPDYFTMCALKEEIENRCGRKVDLLRLRPTLRPLLKQRIERDGIYA